MYSTDISTHVHETFCIRTFIAILFAVAKKKKKNKEIETTLKSFIRELFESIIAHLHYEALNYVAIKKSKENLCW